MSLGRGKIVLAIVTITAGLTAWLLLREPTPIIELSWIEADGYRWASLDVSGGTSAGFTRIESDHSGIRFGNHVPPDSLERNRHYANGSGVATGDVNGDGLPDLYFAALFEPNALYLNRGGLKFDEVAEASGALCEGQASTGVVMADVDGDRDLDIIVTALGGPNCVLLNDGTGMFEQAADNAGITGVEGAMSASLADVDGDGDLDLYVSNYKRRTVRDYENGEKRTFEELVETANGALRLRAAYVDDYILQQRAGRSIVFEAGEVDRFFLNDGKGRFEHVPFTSGRFLDEDGEIPADAPRTWALAVRFQDLNGDGAPDLYVCNDLESPDDIWMNDGRGGFRRIDRQAIRKTSYSSMAVDMSDVNRDGLLDVFVADMLAPDHLTRQQQVAVLYRTPTGVGVVDDRPQEMQNTLFVARGDGSYLETARQSGVAATGWTWSSLFLDVDLDGYEDLLIANGNAFDQMNADTQERIAFARSGSGLSAFPRLALRNVAFRNAGESFPRFEPVENGWGFGDEKDVSHGMAAADFDLDGDLDVVVNRFDAKASLFRNDASARRLAVRLVGSSPNTQAVGARIQVEVPGLPTQMKEAISGGHFLSGSDAMYTFAAGAHSTSAKITVTWRDGSRSVVDEARPNHVYEIDDTRAHSATPQPSAAEEPWFEEAPLSHTHVELPYQDFERQPLLPRSMSGQGPAAAWFDVDEDGDEDLIVGTGRGGSLSLFDNRGGKLVKAAGAFPESLELYDVMGIVGVRGADHPPLILVAVSNYERQPGEEARPSEIRVYETGGKMLRLRDRLPFGYWAIGALTLGDFDGDGDLDLFAAGRHIPGRYPEPPRSAFFLNEGGRFEPDPSRTGQVAAGMISGAAAGDIDGDGDQDLVTAEDWGPVRFYRNENNSGFFDASAQVGLQRSSGRWSGVVLGDFNGDGMLDVAASNIGWNTPYGQGARAYYGDFDRNGVMDVIEAVFDESRDAYLPLRSLTTITASLPAIRRRTSTHRAFAGSTAEELFPGAAFVEARLLASTVFLNGRAGFEAVPLPPSAQATSAQSLLVADANADGSEDLFLSQNLFGVHPDDARLDAGTGLWLIGNGAGRFEPLSGSGVAAHGEQRAAAASDFDGDGRTDLILTQNGTRTLLYRNTYPAAGFRVRLNGPRSNPDGVGAILQVQYSDGSLGPARVVSAGAGYLSQSGAVQVLGVSEKPVKAVRVTWPDGTTTDLPPILQ